MAEPIDPPGTEYARVSRKLVWLRLLVQGGNALIGLLILGIPLILLLTGVWPGFPGWLAWLLPAAELVIALWRLALVPRQVRAIGFAERDEDLLFRSGLFFQQVLVIPYGRMQYVDVTAGPLERLFGLAQVKLHTAYPDTKAQIPGLLADDAARLREKLSALGEAKLAGL